MNKKTDIPFVLMLLVCMNITLYIILPMWQLLAVFNTAIFLMFVYEVFVGTYKRINKAPEIDRRKA